ncbi:hypothetical protein OAB56_01395 [Gammaproteobacteria bacterium]|jgi:hypothetical protein|nr:hypothetical protein [Gammaproteobacteria bacterium]
MKTTTLLEEEFHHDGKGPGLERVIWSHGGVILKGFEYLNPEDEDNEDNIKHLKLLEVEAFSMTTEEVHGNVLMIEDSVAAIFKIDNSDWMKQFKPEYLDSCNHYQLIFHSEIYDVICHEIKFGKGRLLSGMQTVEDNNARPLPE